jgi:signal transduction histidine kinase
MLENEKVDDTYLDRLRKVGGLQDLYVRVKTDRLRLRDWLEDSLRTVRLMKREAYANSRGTTGDEVFQNGNALFVNRAEDIEAIIPFKTEKKCQTCHDVPIGYVLGVAHIQLPLEKINRAIGENSQRQSIISGGFAVVTLIIVYLLYFFLIARPVKLLVGATEALEQGNLSYEIPATTKNDELGILTQSFERMRKALRQSQDALRTSTVGQIATSLIRDFRAPMRQILSAVEQIEKSNPNDEDRARLSATARNSVVDMNKMAQDLLDFTTGEMKVNKRSANLSSLISYVVDSIRPELERDMVRLETEQGFQKNVPLDYERMSRALINIISYSVNYIPPGGTVKISTLAAGTSAVISIADNGSGIPAQFRDKIFDPFSKFVQEKGLGLALALAKRTIDSQGGRIEVDSHEGKGTTFTITMPLS